MKKILTWFDKYALKIGIGFLIIFTALYPKLPSVHIVRTWVYIRLEDFFILGVTIIWLMQLVRGKVKIVFAPSFPVFLYWLAGLISLINCLIFIGPNLINFFPHIAVLNYLRRIEYMILFLVALTSVRNIKDVKDYIIILALTTSGVVFYGLGQRYYLNLWTAFPAFFEKYSFCFPSFQTGNEEFAKGLPLCLEAGSRINSTFGGHYDLAAYLVLVIPIILLVTLSVKKLSLRILTFLLFLGNLILLIFTSSRVSFFSYLIASVFALIFYKRKLYIIPLIIISAILLTVFSGSTAKRLLSTARLSSVVTDMQGQLIGEAPSNLSDDLKNKISKNQEVLQKPPSSQNLPLGSGYIGLPQNSNPVETNTAIVSKTLTPDEVKRLNIASGSLKLSTVSGDFVIRKVLVYDISFTTRFQAEWPNAMRAFLTNPILGSGYSTITLATDNDYLRALGETGLFGFLSFLFIFFVLGITLKEISPSIEQPLVKSFVFGTAGGVIGLMINATLIDVFEASKVAENLWILLGIATGALLLLKKHPVPYMTVLKKVFTSNLFIGIYLLGLILILFASSSGNFFVDRDFSWLRFGASASVGDITNYFIGIQNNLYMPLVNTIVFFLYTFFSFQPAGYHIFVLILIYLAVLGVYLLAQKLFKKRLPALLAALVFLLLPVNAQNIFWFSTFPVTLATVFILYALIGFYKFRESKSLTGYIAALIFSALCFISYELFIILPLLFIAVDLFIFKKKLNFKNFSAHVPFILLLLIYFVVLRVTFSFFDLANFNLYYLGSAGFSILLIAVADMVSNLWTERKKMRKDLPLIIFVLLILIFSFVQTQRTGRDWQKAGDMTKNTLTDLKVDYESFKPTTNVYFVNVPEKLNNVRVYSEGLTDSMWFIYQKNNPRVFTAQNVDEAKKHMQGNMNFENYIFIFQQDGSLKLVK